MGTLTVFLWQLQNNRFSHYPGTTVAHLSATSYLLAITAILELKFSGARSFARSLVRRETFFSRNGNGKSETADYRLIIQFLNARKNS